ncbi:MAG: Gx transporter family protein [Clostridia bacterium]|nr:Gx transporter family protein [Clostridia bacterium]
MNSKKNNVNPKLQKLALTAVLSAQAIVLSFAESLIPISTVLPPGAKIGLANIVTMFAVISGGFFSALTVTILKSLFILIISGPMAFTMSISGGIVSLVVMTLIFKLPKNPFGIIGVSIIAAVSHNFAQLLVSVFITHTKALFWTYSPALLIFGIIAGILTGLLLNFSMPLLKKQEKYFGSKTKV